MAGSVDLAARTGSQGFQPTTRFPTFGASGVRGGTNVDSKTVTANLVHPPRPAAVGAPVRTFPRSRKRDSKESKHHGWSPTDHAKVEQPDMRYDVFDCELFFENIPKDWTFQ